MQSAFKAFPGLEQFLKRYLSTVESAVFLTVFTLLTYWRLQAIFSPGTAVTCFFFMLMIGFGSVTKLVVLPCAVRLKYIITSQLFLGLFFVLAAAVFPRLLPATSRWIRLQEITTANSVDESFEIERLVVKIDPDKPPAMFNVDGSPRLSFTQDQDGVIRVFPADVEYDPYSGQKTFPVKEPETRAAIIGQARVARDKQIARERADARARDEGQRKGFGKADRPDREPGLISPFAVVAVPSKVFALPAGIKEGQYGTYEIAVQTGDRPDTVRVLDLPPAVASKTGVSDPLAGITVANGYYMPSGAQLRANADTLCGRRVQLSLVVKIMSPVGDTKGRTELITEDSLFRVVVLWVACPDDIRERFQLRSTSPGAIKIGSRVLLTGEIDAIRGPDTCSLHLSEMKLVTP